MSAHGEAAEQVVDMATKATVKGVEVVANLTGKGLISLATFLIATLKEQKRTKGKTRIEAFRGKPTKVFVMRREDFSQFAAEAMLSPRESPRTWNTCWTMPLPAHCSLTRS